jgi:hypothetical protein
MALPPVWLSADFQAWQFAQNTTFMDLVHGAGNATRDFLAPVRAAATKSEDVTNRLKTWYTERIAETTTPIQNLTDAAAGFVEDTWTTGVHAYMPLPEFGGFPVLRDNLIHALNSGDPNRPLFSDNMYAGGVVFMVAGGRMQVLAVAMTLSWLLGGKPDLTRQAMQQMVTESPALNDFAGKIYDMGKKVPALWDNEQREFMNVLSNSAIAKLADKGFPLSLLDDPNQALSVSPDEVVYGKQINLTVRGSGFRDSDVLEVGGTAFRDTVWVDEHMLTCVVLEEDWLFSNFAVGALPVKVLDTTGRKAPRTAGQIVIHETDVLDRVTDLAGTDVFNSWKALSVGTAVNAVVPGATGVARMAVNVLDNLGNIARDGGNIVTAGLDGVGDLVSGTLDAVADVTDQVDEAVEGTLAELGEMEMATMIIPPALGGIHQLGWALSQGLSEFAPNAPLVEEDQCVLAFFLCAGAVDVNETVASIRKFGSTFGIPGLASWGT